VEGVSGTGEEEAGPAATAQHLIGNT
jgi:hypothetical protein